VRQCDGHYLSSIRNLGDGQVSRRAGPSGEIRRNGSSYRSNIQAPVCLCLRIYVYIVCTRVKVLYNSMYIACLVILLRPQPYRITESGVQRGKRKISH
jgi:hypothetical protein